MSEHHAWAKAQELLDAQLQREEEERFQYNSGNILVQSLTPANSPVRPFPPTSVTSKGQQQTATLAAASVSAIQVVGVCQGEALAGTRPSPAHSNEVED